MVDWKVITAADALAFCLSQPGANVTDCNRAVADQMVDGVYCDGDVVMVAGQPKRCVPTSVLERKWRAEIASPLPAPVAASGHLALVVGLIGALAALAFYASRQN